MSHFHKEAHTKQMCWVWSRQSVSRATSPNSAYRVSTMKLAWHTMGFTVTSALTLPVLVQWNTLFYQKSMFSSFVSKIWPMLHMRKMHLLFVLKQHHQRGIHFLGGGVVSGDCLSGHFRSLLYYYCLLSFINCSAVCSRPRWQRSVEALTGTCVLYQAKRRYRMRSWAEP